MTPPEARSPIVTCVMRKARNRLSEPMEAGKVRITIPTNRFRLTKSVRNTPEDVERFLAALLKV